jgi:hypothetical protein
LRSNAVFFLNEREVEKSMTNSDKTRYKGKWEKDHKGYRPNKMAIINLPQKSRSTFF